MKVTADQLIIELSSAVEAIIAKDIVESYVEMAQRFLVGDWGPAELNGGRLCEAVSRGLLQLDTENVNHSKLPGKIREILEDQSRTHILGHKDRFHISRVIGMIYKFRSDRGAVHISPSYTANYMDSMLVLHAGKWLFAEFLRLAWNQDQNVVADTIAQIVQLEHSIIHELEGKPLVLAMNVSAPEEVLLLLNHAPNNRLRHSELIEQAANQKPQNVRTAVSRLIKSKELRPVGSDEVALTPNGQKRVIEKILPKL